MGEVVGVGFRAWAVIEAKKIGVSGWIRNVYNRPDIFGVRGGVEVVIQGEENRVKQMVKKLKEGPPAAIVIDIQIFWEIPEKIYSIFEIRN